jgi:glycosyltransferase involved in cell wall biosynthesis
MISGTPILVNAPENTAYFQYAKQYKWGYLLPTNIKEKMKRAILELMQNEILRKQLGSKAKSVAIEKHDVKKVRNDLRIQFWKACENSNVSFNHADTI